MRGVAIVAAVQAQDRASGRTRAADDLTLAAAEGVGCDLVLRVRGRLPGLVLVDTDTTGTGHRHDWRAEAPARELFELPEWGRVAEGVSKAKLVYFSGITLSLYSNIGIGRFLALIEMVRQQGATLISFTRSDSLLAQISDIVVAIDTLENTFVYAPMTTRLAHLAVVDVIATAVAQRSGPKGVKLIKRVKGALKDEWMLGAELPDWVGAKDEDIDDDMDDEIDER